MDFTGQKVLITGASRGIGRATAIAFAKAGATVAVHYGNNRSAAEETLNLLEGDGHMIVQALINDSVAVQTMVNSVIAQLGGLDILVNNAGVYDEHKIAEVDYETWQSEWLHTLQVNLIGVANTIWCASQHMIANGGGRIVNVTSRGAFRGEPDAPAYGAAKAGLNSLTGSMARTLAQHNIYVTAVAPGWVDTDMADGYLSVGAAQSPLNRAADPSEIADAVLYLASENAKFTTGAILDVNGASYLRN